MSVETRLDLNQRAEYTFKYNLRTGRHGWLRLTPAYSVKIVEEILSGQTNSLRVIDPFCGTGTTGLCAAYHGYDSATIDINPFLVWLVRAKTDHYTPTVVSETFNKSETVLDHVRRETVDPMTDPPIYNIERWWSQKSRLFLRLLQAAINRVTSEGSQERTLLEVAFCRTVLKLSKAAFNHQSMSFSNSDQLDLALQINRSAIFKDDVRFILEGARENPGGKCRVTQGDAKTLSECFQDPFDLVITSPPYVNRMSYIRELRPYMYWLRYLVISRDAGELDWASIGGTWGIATSRLNEWHPQTSVYQPSELKPILEQIAHKRNPNGRLLSRYVSKYFEDMALHLIDLRKVLATKASIHYIIGNSTFYNLLVPVELLLVDILKSLGFGNIRINPIRKRNSKKELVEFDVSATYRA